MRMLSNSSQNYRIYSGMHIRTGIENLRKFTKTELGLRLTLLKKSKLFINNSYKHDQFI
jgi:hypothetical protein